MFRARQFLVSFFLILFFLSLILRLFYLQVIKFKWYSNMAAEQHNRICRLEPRRGTIFDRYMEPLAINLDAPSVYADPGKIKEKERTADILSKTLHVDRTSLLEKFNRDKSFVWVKRKTNDDAAGKTQEMKLKGVYLLDESKRIYPNDSMAAHIIGFAGIDNRGLEGLERRFDTQLRGKDGWSHLIRDAKSRNVLFNEKDSMPPQNGYNLVLTIDSVIQYIVEDELKKMVRKFHASGAQAVVMDPRSGEILALANYPDYDLNAFSEAPRGYIKNAAISSVYEPGSVFKIVTASAALNEGVINPDDRIYCENGEYRTNGRVLHDYHRYGDLSFRDVIVKSSNIGTVKAAQKLGEKTIYEYIHKFGFGEKTGIELPGEVKGICRPPESWSRSDITTIPIGQGIAVTPLQLACAISVVANGGYLVKPYVVDRITTWEGITYRSVKPAIRHKILTDRTCKTMTDMLRRVVTDGTGRRARSKLYEMCGKTGTAQMVRPGRGYYSNKYNATFIGFAPAELPVISVVVAACDPHPVYFGGSVAGPAFKRIAERTLQYLEHN